jgi:large subunit ribosomal protein L22
MSKQAKQRREADTESKAILRVLRTSPRKLNVVAQSIRGKSASAALAQLTFSSRRIAVDVKKALQSAIANAENNHQLDVDRLYVVQASVGKSLTIKRFHARARGRASMVQKPFSHLTIVVGERAEEEKVKSNVTAKGKEAAAKRKAQKAEKK